MNPTTAKNLDKLQDMIAQTIDNLIAIGDLDRAGRALECAKARIQEVAA